MSLKSTRIKNYKADELYVELFRRHMNERFDHIDDVIVHHVMTHTDGVTHTVSVELYMDNGDILFRNLKVVTARGFDIVIFLTPELEGRFNATR